MPNESVTSSAFQENGSSDSKAGTVYSFVGVGIGPANLSLAALCQPLPGMSYQFFDRRLNFTWHPGLSFAGATLQVSFLKDLVTLVDPTNPYSFLSFLVARKRLYRFLAANFPSVLRAEYDQYYQWAAAMIPGLKFGHEVTGVDFDELHQQFRIETTRGHFASENLVLGTGLAPAIPDVCLPYLGDQVFHAGEFTLRNPDLRNREVVVLGGGQTGAEVLLAVLRGSVRPRGITWISRRPNFLPLDDSPFTNELFFPNFARYFHGVATIRKEQLLDEHKLASDGISMSTLSEIYRELYAMECIHGVTDLCRLIPENELLGLESHGAKLALTLRNKACGKVLSMEADTLILCTGYRYRLPDFLASLLPRIRLSNGYLKIREDHSVDWDGPSGSKIYVQNAGRHEWGVADPNLSLLSWRSATIVNSLVGYLRYDVTKTSSAIDFDEKAEKSVGLVNYRTEE